ncbi:MAG: hypothetical protein RR620_13820 [Clostridium sp.]
MSFVYANPGSGPSAGGIGWVNFGNLTLNPGQTIPGITGTLKDGSTVTFDLSSPTSSAMKFDALQPPSTSVFGYINYIGILGNALLQNQRISSSSPGIINISNIVVKDSSGNPLTNYTAIIGDAEETNIGESWNFLTDGGNWNLFFTIPGNTNPTLSGTGTQSATVAGVDQAFPSCYILTTQAPKNLTFTAITAGGLEAVALGFAVNRVIVRKNVGARLNSNDQFLLDIQGTPSSQATTTGSLNGIQNEIASVYAFANTPYSITEQMAPGSVSPLSAYTQTISATNVSVGGTPTITGSLPINVTPALGDIMVYDILNSVPETFSKTVDKAYADLGDVLTYSVTINNPNNFAVTNVVMTDPLPPGTTFIDILSVTGAPSYTGSDPSTGITLSSIAANSSATITWRVKVNSTLPMFNSVTNVANISVPGPSGTAPLIGSTNPVTTLIKHADLVSPGNFIKSGIPTNANIGDIITYTLTVTNTGNTAANNIVITDPIPAGTTYVPGSITSSASFTGDPTTTINLTAPIAPSQSVTISFKVKVGNAIPNPNPILNKAEIAYNYIVDPASNPVLVNGFSTVVNTPVSNATLVTKKSVDKTIAYVGDVLTYNISVTNTGNVPANNVIITDLLPNGTVYSDSLTVSVPYTGTPATSITLTNPIAAGQTVSISFKVTVTAIPNPNPINNTATVNYSFTVNPQQPDGVTATSTSNIATTVVFKYNFSQQITDLIESVALEEAALSAIMNSEGAKIQAMVAMNGITPQELLCVNRSVSDMLASISILQAILKQKLSIVNCQIDPTNSSCS